jgi:mRNA interferase MazF
MKRGEIWSIGGGADYAGKPRPAIIVQDDRFETTASVTVCSLTTNDRDAPIFRPSVEPSERNGLLSPSRLMVDKLTTVPRTKVGRRIGRLDDDDMLRLNRAILVFLGLAGA